MSVGPSATHSPAVGLRFVATVRVLDPRTVQLSELLYSPEVVGERGDGRERFAEVAKPLPNDSVDRWTEDLLLGVRADLRDRFGLEYGSSGWYRCFPLAGWVRSTVWRSARDVAEDIGREITATYDTAGETI